MSVALLERRLADSAKTRGTIIQAIKTEDRYKEHRIKRKWKASEVFAMIKESQNDEKYLARRDARLSNDFGNATKPNNSPSWTYLSVSIHV